MHASPPQAAVLTLPSAAELSQRNTEAALLWRKIAHLVKVSVHGKEVRQSLLDQIGQAHATAVESAAYLAAESTVHPINHEQVARMYGALTDQERIAADETANPMDRANARYAAALLRATLDEPSAPGGQA